MDGSPTNLITAGHLEGSVDRFDPPRTIAGLPFKSRPISRP